MVLRMYIYLSLIRHKQTNIMKLLLLLLLSCIAAVYGRSGPKIVGGVDVNIEDYPYQVSLQRILHICGASVLNKNYIVTAAHCTRNYNASQLTIRAGTSTRNKGGVVIQVKTINQHPKYNALSNNNDISILELKSSLTFDETIKPVKLPQLNEDIPEGLIGVVTGWGKDKEDGEMTQQLRKLDVPVRNIDECKKIYGGVITDHMLCAGYLQGGLDACQGDSGGPFAYNGTLIGIVSWGKGCARPNKLGIYAKVPVLRDFITEITGL